jgi:hypothetical protein
MISQVSRGLLNLREAEQLPGTKGGGRKSRERVVVGVAPTGFAIWRPDTPMRRIT